MKKLFFIVMLIAVLVTNASCGPASTPAPTVALSTETKLPFEGITIRVMSQTGPTIVGPVYTHGEEFTALTGAKIEVVEVPGGDLFTKIVQTASAGGSDIDLLLAPNTWMGDFASLGIIAPLESYVDKDKNDPDFDWSDVPQGIVSKNTWGGHIYGLMPDNNNHILFYRKDILNDPKWQAAYKQETGIDMPVPPQTIEELISVAKFFMGKDWAGDGQPDKHYSFVTSVTRGSQAFWYSYSWFSAYGVTPTDADHPQSVFLFKPDMTSLLNSPGYVKGLEQYIDMVNCCTKPGLDTTRGDVINQMVNGTVLLAIDWKDIGPNAVGEDSVVKGKIGFAMAPGSKQYYDWLTDEWVTTDTVKFSPTHAFNGWCWFMLESTKNKDAAWAFIKFMVGKNNSSLDVTDPQGYTPWRTSHITSAVPNLEKVGWAQDDAQAYIKAIIDTTNNPNAVVDLRIPGAARIQDTVELYVTQALSGEVSAQESMDQAAQEVQKVIDDIGKDKMISAYRSHLGLPK